MSSSMPVGAAREQLQELIAILRELRNAGPRDQSFKQWRQVTLTLLQRIWTNEPARAAIFRRILFSAPTARSDAAATREYFQRGCSEAAAYLEGLALELETGVTLKTPPSAAPASNSAPSPSHLEPAPMPERIESSFEVRGDGAAGRALPFRPTRPFEPPAEPIFPEGAAAEPEREATAEREPVIRWDPSSVFEPSELPPAPEPAAPPAPEAPQAKAPPRPKARLKDMLGFVDEPAATRPAPAAPMPPPAAAPPPTPIEREVIPAARPPLTVKRRPAPEPVRESAAPEDAGVLDQELEADLASAEQAASEEIMPGRRGSPTLAAREVLSMAALVAELGVPAQRRAIVRAALIDLGRQMDTPPVHWAAMRQALSFMLDYPQIARRVLPLIMPYLEEAA